MIDLAVADAGLAGRQRRHRARILRVWLNLRSERDGLQELVAIGDAS